jgi:hypothetical protein
MCASLNFAIHSQSLGNLEEVLGVFFGIFYRQVSFLAYQEEEQFKAYPFILCLPFLLLNQQKDYRLQTLSLNCWYYHSEYD